MKQVYLDATKVVMKWSYLKTPKLYTIPYAQCILWHVRINEPTGCEHRIRRN